MRNELYHQMSALEDRHWWFAARRQIVSQAITRIARPPAAARILDAGCGTGGNLAMLGRFGRVTGVEPDDTALELARGRNTGAEIVKGMLPDALPFDDATFDLAVLLDVLEHVDDDRGALRRLAALLKPGGHLVLTVPAFRFLWSGHDESHQHRRRYRRPELSEKIASAGLRVRCISYFNTWLFPLIAAARAVKRQSANRRSSDLFLPPPPVNSLLRLLMASERHAIGRISLPAGVSLIACAAKPPDDNP